VRTLADVGKIKMQRTIIFHASELLCNSNSNYKRGEFILFDFVQTNETGLIKIRWLYLSVAK
jgi:hypothetical protein